LTRFIYAESDRRQREQLRDAAMGRRTVTLIGTARDGQEAVQAAIEFLPDVVVLPESLRFIDGFTAAQLIVAVAPQVKPILLVESETPGRLRQALRSGVRQCLPRSVPIPVLLQVVEEVGRLDAIREQPEYCAALDPRRFPRVIAVTGAKGGIGKTSTATNLAVALARLDQGETCLVDLYTQFGDVATLLDLAPTQTLVDLVSVNAEIDLDVLSAVTMSHASGLRVILGSSSPRALDALPVPRLDEIFVALRQRYRFIVVDVPNLLHAGTVRVLETAYRILLLCSMMDLTAVADTQRWLTAVQESSIPVDRVRLVVNRVGRESMLPVAEVERSLGMTAWAQIPNDLTLVAECANRGVPFVTHAPGHPVSQAVVRMAEALAEDREVLPAHRSASRGGFWRRLPAEGLVKAMALLPLGAPTDAEGKR